MSERTEKQKRRDREYRKKHAAHYAKLNKEWIKNNKDRYNASKARYRLKLKIEALRLYSNPIRCSYCGFDELDGLVLDHIHNNGSKHRAEKNISCRGNPSGTNIYALIRKEGKIDGLQVLCANCNTIKQLRLGREKSIKDKEILSEIEKLYANYNNSV